MEFVRQSLAILFVFAVLWAALWVVRKKGWSGIRRGRVKPDLVELRGRLVLTARHSIHLIRIGNRNVILVLHPDGVTFLGDVDCEASHKEMAAT